MLISDFVVLQLCILAIVILETAYENQCKQAKKYPFAVSALIAFTANRFYRNLDQVLLSTKSCFCPKLLLRFHFVGKVTHSKLAQVLIFTQPYILVLRYFSQNHCTDKTRKTEAALANCYYIVFEQFLVKLFSI